MTAKRPRRPGTGPAGTAAPAVPWWGLLSSTAAPVLLIGGWTLAAALQPAGFDPVTETISTLAAYGTPRREVMTAALFGLGACHLTTALALRPAAWPGRLLLAVGGLATMVVAAVPLPADGSGSTTHLLAAAVAFGSLAGWPAFGWRRNRRTPVALRPAVAIAAATVLLALVGWLVAELLADGVRLGLAERAAAGAQALWPFVVVAATRRG